MTPESYMEWCCDYAATFGWPSPSDENNRAIIERFAAWHKIFVMNKYTIEVLTEATHRIANYNRDTRYDKRTIGEIHLRWIIEESNRIVEASMKRAAYDPRDAACDNCSGAGFLSVPHPKYVVNGVWTASYTTAVFCFCEVARVIESRWRHDKKPMTVFQYEKLVPNWLRIMDAKAEELRIIASLSEPVPVPKTTREIISRLIDRYSING